MTKIYVLAKVDISEGSDYRPSCVGAYGSESSARNKALHELEDCQRSFEVNGIRASLDEDGLRCADDTGTYGVQFGISEIELTGVQVGNVSDL